MNLKDTFITGAVGPERSSSSPAGVEVTIEGYVKVRRVRIRVRIRIRARVRVRARARVRVRVWWV